SDASSDSTSLRMESSPAQALSRNVVRSCVPSSVAASARSMIFCQRSGVITVIPGDLSTKISLGPLPLALNSPGRDLHNLGGLVDLQSAKESQLDDLALSRIKGRQTGQGVIPIDRERPCCRQSNRPVIALLPLTRVRPSHLARGRA